MLTRCAIPGPRTQMSVHPDRDPDCTHCSGQRAINALWLSSMHLVTSHSVPQTDSSCNHWGWGKASYASIRYINRNKVEGAGWLCLPARICKAQRGLAHGQVLRGRSLRAYCLPLTRVSVSSDVVAPKTITSPFWPTCLRPPRLTPPSGRKRCRSACPSRCW